MEFSIFTRLKITSLIYRYWLRDLPIEKIKTEDHYKQLLEITDKMFLENEVD